MGTSDWNTPGQAVVALARLGCRAGARKRAGNAHVMCGHLRQGAKSGQESGLRLRGSKGNLGEVRKCWLTVLFWTKFGTKGSIILLSTLWPKCQEFPTSFL